MVLLVSSGVAPNSDLPSLRTSTFKRYVNYLAIGGPRMLTATAVSIAHVFIVSVLAGKPQFILINPFADCCRLCSTRGPSTRRQPRWKPRSRRHDWRISLGYGRGMHSRSCWTCRRTSRHSLHSFLVDNGRYRDDRWIPSPCYMLDSDCFRIHIRQRRRATSISSETLPLHRSAGRHSEMTAVMLCMMRNGPGYILGGP